MLELLHRIDAKLDRLQATPDDHTQRIERLERRVDRVEKIAPAISERMDLMHREVLTKLELAQAQIPGDTEAMIKLEVGGLRILLQRRLELAEPNDGL